MRSWFPCCFWWRFSRDGEVFTLPHAVISKVLKCLCLRAQNPRTNRDNGFPLDRKNLNSGEYITSILFPKNVWCHLLMVSHCSCWPSIHLSFVWAAPGRDPPPVHVEPVEPFTSLILTGRGAKTPAVLPLKEGMSEAIDSDHSLRRRFFVGFH